MARTLASRSGAAVVAVFLATGVTACGDEAQVVEPGQEGTTSTAKVAQVSPGDDITVNELLARLSSPGLEVLRSFDFALDLAADTDQLDITGEVHLDGQTPALQVSTQIASMGSVEVVYVDGSAYVSLPSITGAGKYFEFSAEEMNEMGTTDYTDSLDLNSLMEEWNVGAQSVTFVGTEDIDGLNTDHFEVAVDPQEVADALGDLTESDPDLGVTEPIMYDLWIDQDDLIRQMALDIDGANATVQFDNWGEGKPIVAPDPSDITTMPNF